MGKLACLVVAVAACGESPGVYLTIQGAGLSQVKVFIGGDACESPDGGPCGISPMGGFDRVRPTDPGGTWFRDPDAAFVADASGGIARVRIQPTGHDKHVHLIVLGLDAGGAPIAAKVVRDLDVTASDATSVTMTLDPATEFDGHAHQSGTFFEVWPDPMGTTECALVESWDNGAAMDTFIVPEADGDCDGVPTLDASGNKNSAECDPYWYMRDDGVGAADCAENLDTVANANVCLLGGQGCKDGVGLTSTACTREDTVTCVPNAICESPCAARGTTMALSSCGLVTGMTPTGSDIHCVIPIETTQGAPCTGLGGNAQSGAMDLANLFTTGGRAISEIDFAPLDQLYGIDNQLQKDQLITPQNDLEIDIVGPKPASPFGFNLQWKLGSAPLVNATHFAVADLTIDQTPNADTHMRLPVRIDLISCSGANVGISCYAIVQPGDTVTSCGM